MSIDGRVNATLQFMQTEVRKLQSHSKACLQMVNWMLRCARRHSPLIHWAYDNNRLDAIPFMKVRLSTPVVPKPVPRMLWQLF